MSHRLVATLLVLFTSAAVCQAGPLSWRWTLTSSDGEVFGSGSGLTSGFYVLNKLPVPVMPTDSPLPSDFTNTVDYVRSVTSAGTLRVTDDLTNTTVAFDLFYTKNEAWRLSTTPDGSTSPEVYGSWHESGPADWSGKRQAGGLLFDVRQSEQYTGVSVDMVATPEPGTLVLGGLAVTGGIGAWWRKRRVSRPA